MIIRLPYPPSVNRYWRNLKGRVLISKAGRSYRSKVLAECLVHRVKLQPGKLKVVVAVYPPDNRRRDLDNLCKALLDAMEYAGVYVDDSQIYDLRIWRSTVEKDGYVNVEIMPHE
jgi:crossover junction endodeoxyribonuclease RusA